MSFPSSPIDNQIATVNGIKYQYSASTNAWTKQPVTVSVVSTSTIELGKTIAIYMGMALP